jgi:riboflavin synthase
MGRVASITNLEGMARLVIAPQTAGEFETALGDSVAVNGACLTVAHIGAEGLSFDVSRETLALTTLGGLKVGSEVNLERAMRVSDRLGGHMVSGHVDGKARILHWDKTPAGWGLEVLVPAELARYVAPKGSITLEGVSLTVNAVADRADGARVSLMLIPVTLERTTLGKTQVGDVVNLETDLIARYLERLVSR